LTLTPGSRLGTYEIVALIGTGGMGEVYRARDTTLNRAVAIKVLLRPLPTIPTGSPASAAKHKRSRR
jgi:serine/threonine protein kinase